MLKTGCVILLLFVLTGCAGTMPVQQDVCATQPGSRACQIETYENAGG